MVVNPGGAPATASSIVPGAGRRTSIESSSSSSSAFAGQLAAAIEKYLGESDNGSRIEIDIEAARGQKAGARQFIVTVKDVHDTPMADPAVTTPAPPLAAAQMLMYSGTVPYVPKLEVAASQAATNEVDAYWAMQPPELRQLRDIHDEGERTEKGRELANQGFAVDVPIMLWRWDPMMTMRARESAGYTWVPSANQAAVELGPGMSMPGMTPYDPGNPPAGSIRVTTEFAKGLEHTSPWWRPPMIDMGTS
jgi:hypothetical protein